MAGTDTYSETIENTVSETSEEFETASGEDFETSAEYTIVSGFTPELGEKLNGFMTIVILAIISVFIVFSVKTVYRFLRIFF